MFFSSSSRNVRKNTTKNGKPKVDPKGKRLADPPKESNGLVPYPTNTNKTTSPLPHKTSFLSYTPSQNCYLSYISFSLSTTLSFDRYASRSSPSSL